MRAHQILCILLILLNVGGLSAQDKVLLELATLPNTTYEIKTDYRSKQLIKFVGPVDELARLQERGISIDSVATMKGTLRILSLTESMNDTGEVPFTADLSYANPTTLNKYVHYDSVSTVAPPRTSLEQNCSAALSGNQFARFTDISLAFSEMLEEVAVGDTLTGMTTLEMEMDEMKYKMDLKLRFELIEIYDGKAYFEVQNQMLNPTVSGGRSQGCDGSGTGTGVVEYTIASKMISYSNVDVEFNLSIDVGKKMHIIINSIVNVSSVQTMKPN
ncbi:MAG: hypothetical protein QNK23_06980 [Crocinitomicaceae bacterium]|nr:hypothetical protein [Crocinitomicaceae bacterium]